MGCNNIYSRVLIVSIFLFAFLTFVGAVDNLMALQGNIQQSGVNLNSGNLTIYIYDAYSGGNLVYNSSSDFNNAISAGKYDVMLGNGSQTLTLEYGKLYYFEMYVNNEQFTFNGSNRQIFQSSVGKVNGTFIGIQQVNSTHLASNINLINATGYLSGQLSGNVSVSQIAGNENLVFTNNSATFSSGQNVSTGVGGWFKGLFNWIVGRNSEQGINSSDYLVFNGSTLYLTTNLSQWLYNQTTPALIISNTSIDSLINSSSSAIGNNTYRKLSDTINQNNVSDFFNNLITSNIGNTTYRKLSDTINKANISDADWVTSVIGNQTYVKIGSSNQITLDIANITNFLYNYNQTTPAITDINNRFYNQTYVDANNASWTGTYNATYALYSYNQTIMTNIFNQHLNTTNNVIFNNLNLTNGLIVNGTSTFNNGWQSGGVSIIDGNLFAQTVYVYNITSLGVSNLDINGSLFPVDLNNTFDVGNATWQWRNGYFATDVIINGISTKLWLYNQTAPALIISNSSIDSLINQSINSKSILNDTNANLTDLNVTRRFSANNSLYVTTSGLVGIGTSIPSHLLTLSNSDNNPQIKLSGYNGVTSGNVTMRSVPSGTNANETIFDLNIYPNYGDNTGNVAYRIFRATDTNGTVSVEIYPGNNTGGIDAQIGVKGTNSYFQKYGGNFGIGTSNPTQKLDVRGNGNFSNTIYLKNGTDVSTWLYNQTIMSNIFNQHLNTTSNVQFGNITTNNLTASGIGLISGQLLLGSNINMSNGCIINNPGTERVTLVCPGQDSELRIFESGGSGYLRLTHDSSDGYVNSTVGDLILAPATGNVGIGTTAPQQMLTLLNGNILVNDTTTATPSVRVWSNHTSQSPSLILYGSNAYWDLAMRGGLGSTNRYALHLRNGSASTSGVMLIPIGGGLAIGSYANTTYDIGKSDIITDWNLGIKTVTPTMALDVRGNVSLNQTLYVMTSGNVGIGATGPTYRLTVNHATAPTIAQETPNYRYLLGPIADDGVFHIKRSDGVIADRLVIDNSGNIGIGTTAPTALLHLYSPVIQMPSNNLFGTTVGSIMITPNGTNENLSSITFGGNNNGAKVDTAAAGIYVDSSSIYGTKMYFATTDSYAAGSKLRMMIDHLGNVAIGNITTPNYLLDVRGNFSANNSLFVDTSGAVGIGRNDVQYGLLGIYGDNGATSGNLRLYNGDTYDASGADYWELRGYTLSGDFYISRNSSQEGLLKLIASTGDVSIPNKLGIGTTTPDYQLDIEKDAFPILRLHDIASGGSSTLLLSGNEGGATDRGFGIMYYDYAGNYRNAINRSAHFVLGSQSTAMVFGQSTTQTENVMSDAYMTPWMTLVAGKLGIGTTTPTHTLNVVGTSNLSGTVYTAASGNVLKTIGQTYISRGDLMIDPSWGLQLDSSATNNSAIYTSAGNAKNMYFKTNNVDAMYISSAQLVGIGTTGPNQALTIYKGDASTLLNLSTNGTRAGDLLMGRTAGFFSGSGVGGGIFTTDTLQLGASNYIALGNSSSAVETMRITGNGLVGIGTASPNTKLEVSGDAIRLSFAAAPTVYSGTLSSVDTLAGSVDYKFTTVDAAGGTKDIYYIDSSSGNVGIGTASPAEKLTVFGNISVIPDSSWSAGDIAIIKFGGNSYLQEGYDASAGNKLVTYYGLNITTNAGQVAQLGTAQTSNNSWFSGAVGIGTTTPLAPLDIRSSQTINHSVLTFKTSGGWSTTPGTNNLFGIEWRDSSDHTGHIAMGYDGSNTNMYFGGMYNGAYKNWSDNLMVIKGNGNVGIGTASPLTTLDVLGSSTLPSAKLGSFLIRTTADKRLAFGVDTTSTMYSWIQSVENNVDWRALVLNEQGGNVGIGVKVPSAKLDVLGLGTGRIKIGDMSYDGYGGISLNNLTTAGNYNFLSGTSDKDLYINRPTGQAIHFREGNGADQIILKPTTGNLGINTITPSQKLEVNGSINMSGNGNNLSMGGAVMYWDSTNSRMVIKVV